MVKGLVKTGDIINGIDAGLCLLDKNLRVIWLNTVQAGWFGGTDKIIGRHCYSVFERRRHICRGCPTVKVFRTGKVHRAYRTNILVNAKKHSYHLTVSPIRDEKNEVIFALELVQDVTSEVLRKKSMLRTLKRLKDLHHHLVSVNRRLRHNVDKLRLILHSTSRVKNLLNRKYRKQANELSLVKKELHDIFRINHALSQSVDVKKIFAFFSRSACRLMHADACLIRLMDERDRTLSVNASFSLSPGLLRKIATVKLGESICGKAAKEKRPVWVQDICKSSLISDPQVLEKEGYRSILCVPCLFQEKVIGVITVFSRKPHNFNSEEAQILSIFASQVALAIQEARYYEDIHVNYFNTIHALVLAIEARDPYTRGHTERVTKYAVELGRKMEMPRQDLETLRYAGEVHDLGKISIPDAILNKPGRLTPSERAMVELHPVKGAEMLEPLDFLRSAIPVVRHHHERYDGTGYPEGLAKERIPLLSRVLACADAFDAMTSERVYRRKKFSTEEALMEIKNNAGSQFDPQIAHLFVKNLSSQSQ